MDIIEKKDVMLHLPYHSFDSVIDFLREAAIDPFVQSIKITCYRLAKNSKVINALINAVRNGKEVMVVLELRARFDEEANLRWKAQLEEEGVKVVLGIGFFHIRRIDVRRLHRSQTGIDEFIVFRLQCRRTLAHLFYQAMTGGIESEAAGVENILQCVFFAAVRPRHRGKANDGRVGTEAVVERKGGEVVDTLQAAGAGPGNGARGNTTDQYPVDVSMRQLVGLQYHGGFSTCGRLATS